MTMTLEAALTNLFTHVAGGDIILPVTPASCALFAKAILAILDPYGRSLVAQRKLAEALGNLSLDKEIRLDGPAAVAKEIAAEVDFVPHSVNECLALLGMGGAP